MSELQLTNPPHKTELVCPVKLEDSYGAVLVSISGGSDSDIVLDLIESLQARLTVPVTGADGAEKMRECENND